GRSAKSKPARTHAIVFFCFTKLSPSLFRRNPIAAHRVWNRNVDRVAGLVDVGLEVSLEADALDEVELARALPEINARRLPGLGQDLGRSDLQVHVQDVFPREVDALLDVHVAVVRHAGGFADRDV